MKHEALPEGARLRDEYETYRDIGYAIRETEGLAAQLEEVGGQ